MRMTTALAGMLVFAVMLYAGDYSVYATDILVALAVNDVAAWGARLIILGGATAFVTALTRLITGSAPVTTPAIVFMVSLLATPTGVISDSLMPMAIKFLVLGFWVFLTISGAGAALQGEF